MAQGDRMVHSELHSKHCPSLLLVNHSTNLQSLFYCRLL